ncbi:hypothetical protein FT663_05169 [Candidozyma haemuli var. vulneris]|uniref:SH3 domain-containing protein n=1 Tax=Candidozyma haemuli TaxID=45357 RepID=A0A2V1AXR5_9ASCO|nr:hypothetical protein CXQ85_002625 [[Candida] haemuloni]KAF3985761.1 hypothetical protein FT663_05169 [[Candida] haemuloni var. vulneris]KAF3988779.1 hypothetical protein FT662_03229 [[Candida] haemuloni var. vulneris]PVH22900.1 hypothetical protein CXQ85_002625 [[Candida] haemuloni]
MPPDILSRENTTTKDYAYPESHPLHLNNYPSSQRSSISSSDSSDLPDFNDDDYAYHDDDTLGPEEINRRAVALFDFEPENDNEVALKEGQVIWISYRHGQGWLVAEDIESGENGLVPEGYVDLYPSDDDAEAAQELDVPKPFIPRILQEYKNPEEDSEWEDTDFEDANADESERDRNSKELTSLGDQVKSSKIQ